jgi:predicted acetyltransferase
MSLRLRPARRSEIPDFLEACESAFGHDISDEEVGRLTRLLEPRRTLATFDDDQIVGTAAAYRFPLTVPGGEVPAAGVTMVGVLPSHRRRGVLRSMTRRQLEDCRKRKEPVAVLWASEGAIYQNFGYGLATKQAGIDIEREYGVFRERFEPVSRVRLASLEEAVKVLPDVYERVRVQTPGMFGRSAEWWDAHRLTISEMDQDDGGPMFRAVLEIDGAAEGYVLYRVYASWGDDGIHAGHLEVLEAMATTPVATRELWNWIFGVDLVARVKSWFLQENHPLFHMLREPRRLRLNVRDALWLRIVDVSEALQARSYAVTTSITFELDDSFCPWNAGTWRLTNERVARVERADDAAPELRLQAADLGSVYLGGVRFAELAQAGRVEELAPGAVRRADALFTTAVAPWCVEIF